MLLYQWTYNDYDLPVGVTVGDIFVIDGGCSVVVILCSGNIIPLITIAGVVSIFSCASMSVTKTSQV